MKIAITAENQGSTDVVRVDPRFGRSSYFVIFNRDDESIEFIKNQGSDASHGAGVQAVQTLVDKDIEVLITGRVGPKAFRGLQEAGIDIYLTDDNTIKNALTAFENDELTKSGGPTGGKHPGRK